MNEELEKVFDENKTEMRTLLGTYEVIERADFIKVVSKLLAENAVTEFERGIVSAEKVITSIKNVAIKNLEKRIGAEKEELQKSLKESYDAFDKLDKRYNKLIESLQQELVHSRFILEDKINELIEGK